MRNIMFKWLVFTGVLVFLTATLYAVNRDSLYRTLMLQKRDTVNIELLIKKAKSMLYSTPDKAYDIAVEAEVRSKIQNNQLWLANSYRLQGSYFSDIKGDAEQATRLYYMADSIYRKSNAKEYREGVGAVYHCFGTIKQRQGDYIEAVKYYSNALRVLDSIKNRTILPKTYNNIANIYSFLKDFEKAEFYARECIKISKEINDDQVISAGCITLADALIEQGKYEEVPKTIDEAFQIASKSNNLYILMLCNYNLANYYGYFRKDYPKAINQLMGALKYSKELGSQWEEARVLTNMAEFYYLADKVDSAGIVAIQALEKIKPYQAIDLEQRALMVLAKCEAGRSNFKKAYEYLNRSQQLKDTVFSESNKRHINYLESLYQSERKDNEIKQLETGKKIRNYVMIFMAILIILLGSTAFFLIKNLKQRKILAEQKVKQLEQEKQLTATHALLEGETSERVRLSRDLHDGLGGMLSVVKLKIANMKGNVTIPEEYVGVFNSALEMLDGSIKELRRVAHNLMPESLLKYGLNPAITDFCNGLEKISYHFYGAERRLDEKLEITIYRIVHELVNNALKHANANQINVQLIIETDRVSVVVQDDGTGFDPKTVTPFKSSGLKNIESRVASFGGQMDLYSAPNKGTEVTVEFNC